MPDNPPRPAAVTAAPDGSDARELHPLARGEAMRLLTGAAFGRVVFTSRALPAVRPVNHIVDGEHIVIRTEGATVIAGAVNGTGVVVAYQVDEIDSESRTGWSVVVTGYAHQVVDPDEIGRYRELLVPWVRSGGDTVVRILPEIVNGFRLGPPAVGRSPRAA